MGEHGLDNITILEHSSDHKGCGHRWIERLALPMETGAAVARMRAWGICPRCGEKGNIFILCGKRYRQAYAEMVRPGPGHAGALETGPKGGETKWKYP